MPSYASGTITCTDPPDPPSEALMVLSSDQPPIFCPGHKAKYECDAGGVNVRKVICKVIVCFLGLLTEYYT